MTPTNSSSPPKEILRANLILFSALATGVFIFMLLSVFISQLEGPLAPDLISYQKPISWIVAFFSLVCLVISRRQLRSGISAAKNSLNPLTEKLSIYRIALIKYLAICELPALLSIILFMLIGNFSFLVFAAVLLGCMLAAIPVRKRVITDLELDGLQAAELE